MVCARRVSVYAVVIGIFVCTQGSAFSGFARDNKGDKAVVSEASAPDVDRSSDFQWSESRKLSWDDFKGPVTATSDESAAATHCGMGFRVNTSDGRPEISVYNTFYINKSWVRPDAKISSILVHEQGHFDLCEIYTRKLKNLMAHFDFSISDPKAALMKIFTQVNNEYEQRQQAYEAETIHGTDIAEQTRWVSVIKHELGYN